MKRKVWPSEIDGVLHAPPSKSAAQRAILIASLANGVSEILRTGTCDDVMAATGVCQTLGATISRQGNSLHITGGIRTPGQPLHCGEAGLAIRMFSGVAATLDGNVTLTGEGSLLRRPMDTIESSLKALGVSCQTTNGFLPVHVRGPLKGGHAVIDGSLSSQILTGILIAAPFAEKDTHLAVTSLKSKPYIDLTLEIMAAFGVEAHNNNHTDFFVRAGQRYGGRHYVVEGDWSGAAFLLVAGAVAGRVMVGNLNLSSFQADKKILHALRMAGARVTEGNNWVEVAHQPLGPFSFDATHCPDLFPPLAALASNCRGESRITGVERLRAKESDRASTLKDIFQHMGIEIRLEDNTMYISGGKKQGATVSAHGDHRIAMAAAIAALNADGPVTIDDAQAVDKSYPDFFDDLKHIMTE